VQLRTARLCLDCEELHEEPHCPVCASETFEYVVRWIPVPERRVRPRQQPPEEAVVYRRLLVADAVRPKAGRLLKRGALGLAALSVARWMWRQHRVARQARAAVDKE
jgi:hypothetical protein